MNENLKKETERHYTQIIAGMRDEAVSLKTKKDFEKVTMTSMLENIDKIQHHVEQIYIILYGNGYGLDDLPYHIWIGEPVTNMKDINNTMEDLIIQLYRIILQSKGGIK